MSFAQQIADAFRPHASALGGTIQNSQTAILTLLEEIKNELVEERESGRPDWYDKWNYCNFSATGAVATPADFNIPVVVPQNEIWLIQHITLTAAATFQTQTDGGQLRGTSTQLGTETISGNIAWLPGEHIVWTASAAVAGTVAAIRRQIPMINRKATAGRSNTMVSGRANTHVIARDNLGQKGLYVVPQHEIRPGEGLERNSEPVVIVESQDAPALDNKNLEVTQDPTT